MENDVYDGFILSKNILKGISVRYTFREVSSIPNGNGWNLYSIEDNEDYISTDTIEKVAPVLLEFFNAPYGTDLCW
ncbi:hypothetical protein [Listeria aquatica]|uniref:hypothetical protein n=1 Tax=Listeria aquatica TaxID=1494960 RepID=UPI0031F57FAB